MNDLLGRGQLDWQAYLAALVLVLIRLSGLMVFAPFFSSRAIPRMGKAVFAVAMALVLCPAVAGMPLAHAQLDAGTILGELGVGLVFGILLSFLNEIFIFAGQVIGVQFSFSLVNLLDPSSSIETPLLGQVFTLFSVLVLLAAGLDRTLVAALMRSFAAVPVGCGLGIPDARAAAAIATMAGGIFAAALQLSAPVLAATMLAEISIGLIGRLSPQLPVLSMTIPVKTILGYAVLLGSLALWPHFVEARFSGLLSAAGRLLVPGAHGAGAR